MTATAVTTPAISSRPTLSAAQAGCLLAAPVVAFAARMLTTPWYQDDADRPDSARYLADLAESPVRNEIGAGLAFVSAALFVGAALVLGSLARQRMPRLGGAGAATVVIGALGLVTVSTQSMVATQIADFGERDTMIPLQTELYNDSALSSSYLAMVVGAAGAVLLAIALYRGRAVPRVAAVLTGLGLASVMLTAPGPLRSFVAGSAVIATIGFGWVAAALWSRRP